MPASQHASKVAPLFSLSFLFYFIQCFDLQEKRLQVCHVLYSKQIGDSYIGTVPHVYKTVPDRVQMSLPFGTWVRNENPGGHGDRSAWTCSGTVVELHLCILSAAGRRTGSHIEQ